MKRILLLVLIVVMMCGVAFASPINLNGSEKNLQLILNEATVGGTSSINVVTDQISKDAIWTYSNSTVGSTQLIIEIAGLAGSNVFGIYDPQDLSKKVVLFTGPAGAGDKASFTLDGDKSILVTKYYGGISTVDTNLIFSNPTEFGFYLDTGSSILLSGDLLHDQMLTYQGVGDSMTIGGQTRVVNAGAYILAWEDVIGGDYDYNDMVLVVESVAPVPEPATMLLMGFGLLGLAGYWRQRS